jgi:membrane associated rhomboid family serine protease
MFVVMCIATKKFGGFTLPGLVTWGANFGPLTVNGQWWRLLTATFVHFNLFHLLLNMWALWNVGRLCERVFGRLTFVFLYFASAVLASLSSIAWNPDLSSVGASGPIFGILGAFLAFFLNPQNRVPATIARRHWISTSAFAVFNLVSGMRLGYTSLVKRYRDSDFVLNRFANMACRAGDADQYRELRESLVKRYSSVAWSAKYSREACDKKFAASIAAAPTAALPPNEPGLGRIQSIGGVQLGMTARQLLDAKGTPIFQQHKNWTYNRVDSSHNGVLTAVFAAHSDGSDEKVVLIEFTGDEASAPPELPYLNGLTEDDLKERFGYLIGMGSPSEDITTLRFRNGIYADTRNGKVFRYGIYALKPPK